MRALLPVSARSGACLTGAGFASFERQERKSIVFTFCSCPGQGTVARNKITFEKQFLSKVHSAGEHEYCCCRFPHVFCDRGQPFKLSPVVSLYSRRFAFLRLPLRSISIRRCGLRTPTATMRRVTRCAALGPPGVETLQRGCCVALRVRRSRQLPAPTVVRAFYDGKALGRRVEVCSIAENGMARRQRQNMLFRIIALAFFSSARYIHLSYFAASRFLKPGLPAEGGDVLARSFSQRRRL